MDSLGAIISPGKKLIVLSLQNPPPHHPHTQLSGTYKSWFP